MFSKKKVFTLNRPRISWFSFLKTSDLEKKTTKKGVCTWGLSLQSGFLPKWAGQSPTNQDCPAKIGTYGRPNTTVAKYLAGKCWGVQVVPLAIYVNDDSTHFK